MKAVLRMLGWKFAEDGPKAPPFSPKVTALGVEVNVSRLHQGFTLIDNTEKRTTELSETIAGFINSGRMSRKEALRFKRPDPICCIFFPSNAFMAFARSLQTFNRSRKAEL